jgi:hypothetical protein
MSEALVLREPDAAARRPAPPRAGVPDRSRLAVWIGVVALALAALARLEPLAAEGLDADVGIQFHLAAETARGAVPLLDFEHGWNTLAWYHLAAFYLLSFGQPTLWSFLWGTAAGPFLAGVVLLVVACRQGLPAVWLLGLTATVLIVSDVPNGKYALPALWLLLLRPGGRLDRPRAAVVTRFALAGLLVLAHIELAVMLCLGTALYDLLGARHLPAAARAARVAALAVGGAVLFGAELAAYAGLGLDPADVVRFLVLERAGVSEGAVAFDASLLRPSGVLGAVFPATLVLPFVPAVWRRLSDTTRLTAGLHLSLGLIAIRKPDEGHVGAASTLLALLLVLAAWDLTRSGLPRPRLDGLGLVAAAAGAAWLLTAVLAGFTAGSVLALPLLLGITALGAVVARRRELPLASAGAVAAGVGLAVVSLAAMAVAEVRGPRDELLERTMATALAPAVERCLGAERAAWVVPEPLALYDTLDLENPTPYYLFWAGFAEEAPEVLQRIEDGEVPAILQQGPWPVSMARVAPVIEDRYELCAEVVTPAVPEQGVGARTVRIWVDP